MSIQAILYQKGESVITIAPETPVRDAAAKLQEENIAALVATKGNAILGIVSERDVVHAFSQHGVRLASMTVRDIVNPKVVTVAPQDSLKRAMNLMTRHRTRHVLVLRGTELAGIVSIGDVVKHRLDDLELGSPYTRDLQIAHH